MALKLIGRTGHVAGHDVAVTSLLRIGAAADNDFRLVVGGVSRHHARILRNDDAYWLEDAGSTNGTFLNGQRVARERLRHLDVITIGRDIDLIVVSADRADAAPPERAVTEAWLEPVGPGGAGRVDLPPGDLTIGRLAPSNVIIESPVVSHLHARFQRTVDHLIVHDLDSANGTFVNGRRIAAPFVLSDGDTIDVAGVRHFRVHLAGEGSRARPQEVVTSQTMVFDQEWQTKMVWSADELAQIEQERRRLAADARVVAAPAAAAPPAAPLPKPPAAAAPPAAPPPKPPAAAAPPAAPPPKPPAAAVPPAAPPPKPQVAAAPPAAPAPPATPEPPAAAAPPAALASPKPPAAEAAPPPAVPPAAVAAAPPQPAPAAPRAPAPPPARPAPTVGTEATLMHAAPPAAVPAPPAAKVRALRLAGGSRAFALEAGRHLVGRMEGVAVPILDPQVSRSHAVISVADGGVSVEDTRSANGTFVNGVRVEGKSVTLKNGDRLAFGTVEFTVELIS